MDDTGHAERDGAGAVAKAEFVGAQEGPQRTTVAVPCKPAAKCHKQTS